MVRKGQGKGQGWATRAKTPATPRDSPSSGPAHPISQLKPKPWPACNKHMGG